MTSGRDMDDRDTELMTRFARQGDEQAFRSLYETHCEPLQRFCQRMLSIDALGEECASETWKRVVEKRSAYQPTAKFTTWLYRIARNCAIDMMRAAEKRPEMLSRERFHGTFTPLVDPLTGRPPPHSTSIPERDAGRERLALLLRQALRTLPPVQRESFALHFENGLSAQEIADILKVSRNTIKTRLRAATEKLRRQLPLHDIEVALGRSTRLPDDD